MEEAKINYNIIAKQAIKNEVEGFINSIKSEQKELRLRMRLLSDEIPHLFSEKLTTEEIYTLQKEVNDVINQFLPL